MTQNNRSRLMNFRVQQCTFENIQQMKFQRLPLSFLPRNGIKCSPPFLVDHRNAIRLLQCNHDPRSAQCPEDQISLHATTKNSTRFPFLSLFCPTQHILCFIIIIQSPIRVCPLSSHPTQWSSSRDFGVMDSQTLNRFNRNKINTQTNLRPFFSSPL